MMLWISLLTSLVAGRAAEPNSASQLIASSSVSAPDRPRWIAAFARIVFVVSVECRAERLKRSPSVAPFWNRFSEHDGCDAGHSLRIGQSGHAHDRSPVPLVPQHRCWERASFERASIQRPS